MRYALLVDGGYVLKKLGQQLKRRADSLDVVLACRHICRGPQLIGHELLRIYYYDAPPANQTLTNPLSGRSIHLSKTELHKERTAMIMELELADDFAVRLGRIAAHGFRVRKEAVRRLGASGARSGAAVGDGAVSADPGAKSLSGSGSASGDGAVLTAED